MEDVIKKIYRLLDEGKKKEAMDICKEYPECEEIQYIYVSILMNYRSDNKNENNRNTSAMKKIFKRFPDNEKIQVKNIIFLLKMKARDKAIEVCKKFPDSNSINLICMRTLLEDNKIEEATTILKKFKYDKRFVEVYKKYVKDYVDDKFEEIKNKKLLNMLKAKLRNRVLTNEDIVELKNSSISDYEKTIALIAIYTYNNQISLLDKTIKEARKKFTSDELKKINTLSSQIKSNKLFDLGLFDKYLKWDNSYYDIVKKELEEKKEKERLEEVSKKEEINRLELERKRKIEEEKERKENEKKELERIKLEEKKKRIEEQIEREKSKVKCSKNVIKDEDKVLKDVYYYELFELKKEIYIRSNFLVEVKDREKREAILRDLDKVEELEELPYLDIKSRLLLVTYLRKYSLGNITVRLNKESELLDNLMKLFSSSSNREQIKETINKSINNMNGDSTYIRNLLLKR